MSKVVDISMKDLPSLSKPPTREEERHTLVKQLQHKARRLKRLVCWWLFGTIVGVEVFSLCCWALSGTIWLPYVAGTLVMTYFLTCVAMGMTLIWDETGEQAAGLRDKRLVGTLLDMLALENLSQGVSGTTVRTSLLHLLPSLHSEDAVLLTEGQRTRLHQLLLGRDIPLIVASLKALEQVGNKTALPFVQRLVTGEGQGAKSAQVRDAVQHCSPLLQERIAQENARRTLLRPTQAENMPDETLLRAAHSSQPTEVQELLRANTSDG